MTLIEDFNTVINDMKAIILELQNSAKWQNPMMPELTAENIKKIAKKIYALSPARETVKDFDYARLEVQFTTAAVEIEKEKVTDFDRAQAVEIIEAVISHLKNTRDKL